MTLASVMFSRGPVHRIPAGLIVLLFAALAVTPAVLAEERQATLAASAAEEVAGEDTDEGEAEAADDADPLFPVVTAETDLDVFLWVNRALVIFADTPADPRVAEQVELLNRDRARLLERDVVILVDNDARQNSLLRQRLRPRGFMIALVGKDGIVHMRRPSPRPARELIHAIDKLPLRREEMRGG